MTLSITSALGAGSGIDINALVANLTAASRAPRDAAVARRETINTARISAMGDIASSIDSLSSALASLIGGGTLAKTVTASDPSVLRARVVPGATIGTIGSTIEVGALARAQIAASAPLTSAAATVGQGRLTLTTAAGATTITIDASNDSLTGLAGAINASGRGISASIVTDADGSARLSLRGATGAANGFSLTLADGDPVTLGRFATDQPGGMTAIQSAADAQLTVDGVAVTRASNSVDDLVPGVAIDLLKAAPGSSVTLAVDRPTQAITNAVSDFVDAYNQVMAKLTKATQSAGAADGTSGSLYGNAAVAQVRQAMAALPTTKLVTQGAGPHALAEIGVRTNRDGTLSVDAYRLTRALAANPDGVEALFNPSQTSSDPNLVIKSAIGSVKPGVYQLTDLLPASGATPASGMIDGRAMTGIGGSLVAPAGSAALGLIVRPNAAAASATITIDPGLGGAMAAIRDSLRAGKSAWAASETRFATETKAIASEREKIDSQSASYAAQLTNSYSAMDARVAAMKATQSYLTQQIALWSAARN